MQVHTNIVITTIKPMETKWKDDEILKGDFKEK